MFCHACGSAIPDGAHFCPGCGREQSPGGNSLEQAKSELREFIIPLPPDSPLRNLFTQDDDRLLTYQQLRLLGINRPEPGDFLPSRGFTHLWNYFRNHVRSRLDELESEGWLLDEPFDPRMDLYGILTVDSIHQRFAIDRASVPRSGLFGGNRVGALLKGFKLRMKRPTQSVGARE